MEISIKELREGSLGVFQEIYECQHSKVFHFFLKRVSNNEDAKELTQDVFIRLWTYKHTLSEDHTIDKQLFVIAYQTLINFLKSKNTRTKKMFDYTSSVANNPTLTIAQCDDEAYLQKDRLIKCIDRLPVERKRIVSLRVFHGYSNKEISERLSISVKTVENQISKAIESIRADVSLEPFSILLIIFLIR